MNIKSLLLGSAAAMIAVSGARAADAIVIAEPEPVEYVRVCDVYGTGYFYIPGTETCLKIGGYFRYEVRNIGYERADEVAADGTLIRDGEDDAGYTTRARFAPTFTVKSETELGTLTGYARAYFQYDSLIEDGSSNSTVIDHMQISLATANGTFLVGKGDNPYQRFLDYGGPTIRDGEYGAESTTEISYTFTGGNGFSAIIAAVDNDSVYADGRATSEWETNFEGGVRFTQAWGWVGAMAAYDGVAENFGATAAVGFKIPNTAVELTLRGFYADDTDTEGFYSLRDNGDQYGPFELAEWSILGGASVALTEKVGLAGTFQWFDTDEYFAAVGLPISPVAGLSITPEVSYTSRSEDFQGILRFQRSF